MSSEYLHKKRAAGVFGACAVVGVLWLIPGLGTWGKAGATLIGCGLGVSSGVFAWRQIRQRIFAGNRVILYYTDTFTYGLLFAAAMVSLAPGTVREVVRLGSQPGVLHAVALATASGGFGMSLTLYVEIRRQESRSGPLLVRTFYAESSTGAEGMLGQPAVVRTACAPEGTVFARGELWRARSLSSGTLLRGQAVVIRDVEGLCLLVDDVNGGAA